MFEKFFAGLARYQRVIVFLSLLERLPVRGLARYLKHRIQVDLAQHLSSTLGEKQYIKLRGQQTRNALSRSHFRRGTKGKLLHNLDTIVPLLVLSEEELGLMEMMMDTGHTPAQLQGDGLPIHPGVEVWKYNLPVSLLSDLTWSRSCQLKCSDYTNGTWKR